MNRAFTKDDPKPDGKNAKEAYEHHRITQLGGGDYEKGKAYLGSLKRGTTDIRKTRPILRKSKKRAKQ
jgi:hypothetical protein